MAPGAGTKASPKTLVSECNTNMIQVDLGKDAPTKKEGAGAVPSESLAAESFKEGGEFTSNKGIHSENAPSKSAETSSAGRDTGRTGNVFKSSGGQAEGHQRRHSKNLEGSWDESKTEDGLQKALNAEPGSDDDPGRLAELKFQQQQAGGGAGPREAKLSTKSGYDALNAETPS
ncbi:hypothetical protein CEP54_000096 [Fusarium duplospermum]|uniref:Uncharacterized protein n=1 Tax=Fusarium duplospermum TaxID=1325734 RepID=A0A428R8A6_9HYPO|nr:hypothetical protein CEP54_000096 [Fusarium duplospermum]